MAQNIKWLLSKLGSKTHVVEREDRPTSQSYPLIHTHAHAHGHMHGYAHTHALWHMENSTLIQQ